MRVPIILLIALVGSTVAVTSDKSLNDVATILAQVSEHPFGNAVGSLIQLHLKNKEESGAPSGRLNAILNVLNTLKNTISKASQKAETMWNGKTAWCSDTIAQLQKEYDTAQKSSANSNAEYNDLSREQSIKKSDLQTGQKNLAELKEDLQKRQTDLETENTQYTERSTDYSEAIAACEEAIRLLLSLSNRVNGESFIQMNQSFGSIKDKLEKHAKNSNLPFVEPIIDVLAELASGSQYDYSQISAIIDLIRSLLDNLRGSSLQIDTNHQKVAADIEGLIENLTNQINTLQSNVGIYDQRLSEIEVRLNELKPLIAQYDVLVDINGTFLEGTKNDCAGAEQLYNEQQASRKKQLDIIQKLIDYFNGQVTGRVENIRDDVYDDNANN